MKNLTTKRGLRCAIYTRVSTDQGLEQDFNSLDAQREASEAYIKSQAHEGWRLVRDRYDDGGFSGGSMDRPALREIIEGASDATNGARPMRANARAILVEALGTAPGWTNFCPTPARL